MNIVVLDGAVLNPGDVDWGPIAALGDLTVYPETSAAELPERARGADVLLVNKTLLRRDDMAHFQSARLVGLVATGYNNVDVDAFAERQVPVCNVTAYGVEDVAQHALALLLELCRRTSEHSDSVRHGDWVRSGRWSYWRRSPICLSGLVMGIVGFGSIGREMARIAHALGMKLLVSQRTPREAPPWEDFAFVSLDELLAKSDVVSLHCPLTPETSKLINAESLALMRPGAILINTARGGLVDEAAVAEALKSGQLGGLGTDVLSQEPPAADNPLLEAPNVLITPHMSWATTRARQKIIDLTAEYIHAWLAGEPINVVNGVSARPAKGEAVAR